MMVHPPIMLSGVAMIVGALPPFESIARRTATISLFQSEPAGPETVLTLSLVTI
jgi:hypothetical protein